MATLKELLTAMVDKINGKIASPAEEPQANMQLVTDADGVTKWEEKLFYTIPGSDGLSVGPVTVDVGDVPIGGGYWKQFTPEFESTEYPFSAFAGLYYVVVWDGVEYRDLEPNAFDSNGSTEVSTDDFTIQHDMWDSTWNVSTTQPGVHTFAIYVQDAVPEEIVQILEKFIPPMSTLALRSPSGKLFKLSVSDDGEPAFAEVTD